MKVGYFNGLAMIIVGGLAMIIVGGLAMIIAGAVLITSGIPRFPIYYGYPYTSIPIVLSILGTIMLIIGTLFFFIKLEK